MAASGHHLCDLSGTSFSPGRPGTHLNSGASSSLRPRPGGQPLQSSWWHHSTYCYISKLTSNFIFFLFWIRPQIRSHLIVLLRESFHAQHIFSIFTNSFSPILPIWGNLYLLQGWGRKWANTLTNIFRHESRLMLLSFSVWKCQFDNGWTSLFLLTQLLFP